MNQPLRAVKIWDLPVRLFHWTLVALLAFMFWSGKTGGNAMEYHMYAGYWVLALVLFRVMWGFAGSNHARFSDFLAGPGRAVAFAKQLVSKSPAPVAGHNPLGGWMVLALLVSLLVQTGTGLFANDDIAFQCPLADLVGKERSNRLTHLHALLQYGLIAVIALHAAAIVFYVRVKRETLLRPMLTGWKAVPREHAPPAHEQHHRQLGKASGLIAFVLAASVASATVYAAAGALLEPAPPPTPAATPSW